MIPNCKKIYLCTPARDKITVLNGIQTDTVDFHAVAKGYSELSFEVDRFLSIDGEFVESNGYEDLKPYMYLFLEDIGYFQMQAPSVNNDGNRETKSVVAYSAEKEFEDKDWQGIKINTGEDDSYERLVDGNLDDLKQTITYITMVNEQKPKLSFLHLILEKVSQWSIGHVDTRLKTAKIPSLDIDNENLYAVMTSEVAPRMSCIFIFDYYNFTINVYHRDNLDFDTGLFIGFRNLAQNIDYSVDDGSIFTRFSVMGDDNLTFETYNYGDEHVFDISYFLGEPYMEQELADKIQDWIQFRDDHRQEYIDLSTEYDKINNLLYTAKYRVPADEDYWKNWDNLNLEGDDGLLAQQKTFNLLLKALQVSVDTRDESEKYDENDNYLPKKNDNDEVDHEWYLNLLYENIDEYSGYYTYLDIVTYILPYIEIAISNYGKPDYQKIKPVDDAAENWALYGYVELDGIRKSYEEDLIDRLAKYSKDWEDMDEEERLEKQLNYKDEEGYENSPGRKEYKKLKEALGNTDGSDEGTIYYYLKILKEQIDEFEAQLKDIADKVGEYNNLARYDVTQEEVDEMTLVSQDVINDRLPLFTQDEIDLITTLFHDTDYQNTNILITNRYSPAEIMGAKKDLYDDAQDKLYEVAQPQYTFSVSLDNFMRLVEYKDWANEFDPSYVNPSLVDLDTSPANGLLKFVRLGIRDNYSVKLRVIGYRWNPCEVTPELQLEFSNMIVSKSGRTDFTQLLDTENNRGAKNSISVGLGNSNSDREYIDRLLELITANSIFTKAVSGIASGTTGGTDSVYVEGLISDYLSSVHVEADTINVGNITGTRGEFEDLFAEYLKADTIVTKLITAEEGEFDTLTANIIRVGEAGITQITEETISTATINADQINVTNQFVSDVLRVGTDTITTIAGGAVTTEKVIASLVDAQSGDFDDLTANTAFIEYLNSGIIEADQVTAHAVVAALVEAEQGDFDDLTANTAFIEYLNSGVIEAQSITGQQIIAGIVDLENASDFSLLADSAFIDYLESNLIIASEIRVDDLKAKLATINVADIDQLYADSAFITSLQSLASTAAESRIDAAYIKNLVAGNVAVSDLKAGDITVSDSMRIISDNGNLIMNSSALQILGTDSNGDPYVGVQLGYATNGQPSLVLRNEDGSVIIDPTGITQDAIADGLIINNMIHTGTISEDKLGFSVMKQGDTISIEKVMTGSGSFGVEYTEFKNGTNSALNDLRQDIEDSANYDLYIETPNGTNIWGGNIQLNVKLLKNNVDVTDDFDASCFIWTRTSRDHDADIYWNSNHNQGAKVITITGNDVRMNADFQCKFEYENITVVAG